MAKLGKKLDKVNKLSKRQAESCIPSPSPSELAPQPSPTDGMPVKASPRNPQALFLNHGHDFISERYIKGAAPQPSSESKPNCQFRDNDFCKKPSRAKVWCIGKDCGDYEDKKPEAPQPSSTEPKTQSYWDTKREQINKLIKELQSKPHEFILGHFEYPESILNAYREGDVLFDDAVQELQRWSYRFVEKNKSQPEPQLPEEAVVRRRIEDMLVLILEAGRWCRGDVDAIMQAITAGQPKCAECKDRPPILRATCGKDGEIIDIQRVDCTEAIKQFKERLIEGMKKVYEYNANDDPRIRAYALGVKDEYEACIAHIRAEKEGR